MKDLEIPEVTLKRILSKHFSAWTVTETGTGIRNTVSKDTCFNVVVD